MLKAWREERNTVIDMHAHILPSIDDGAANLDVSVEMLDAAAGMGFRTIVATPHLTEPLTPAYAVAVREAFRQVEGHAGQREIELLTGFEVRLTPDLPLRLRQGEPVTLGQGRVVLVDLPFFDWPPNVETTLFEVQTAGFLPILAHPERYPTIQEDPALGARLAERGIALQVTIGSFSGVFGKQARRAAEELLALRAVHLVATDAHSAGHRMAAVPEGLRRLENLAGDHNVQHLTLHGPDALLRQGVLQEPITPLLKPAGRLRKIWRLVDG